MAKNETTCYHVVELTKFVLMNKYGFAEKRNADCNYMLYNDTSMRLILVFSDTNMDALSQTTVKIISTFKMKLSLYSLCPASR